MNSSNVLMSRWNRMALVAFFAVAMGVAWSREGWRELGVEVASLQLDVRDGRVWLDAENIPLRTLLAELGRRSGVAITVDAKLEEKVTTRISGKTLEETLQELCSSKALTWEKTDDGYRLVAAFVTRQEEAPSVAEAQPVPRWQPPPGVLVNSDRTFEELAQRRAKAILLENAYIDVEAAREGRSLSVPEQFRADPNTEYVIVQFDRPLSDEVRQRLEERGAQICHYVPRNAYAVRISPKDRAALAQLEEVTHIEPYHPYFKLSPEVRRFLTGEPEALRDPAFARDEFQVVLFTGADLPREIEALGFEVLRTEEVTGRRVLRLKGPAEHLDELARVDSIQWVEARPAVRPMNDLAAERIRVRSLRTTRPELTGEGVIINVTDTGVDFINPGFAVNPSQPTSTGLNTRIVYYEARPSVTSDGVPGDNDGHGTHVAGSILGNGALSETVIKAAGSGTGIGPYPSNYFAGMAPGARLIMLEDFNSFTDVEQASISYRRGARISNNSWGANVFTYGAESMVWDGLVRDALGDVAGNQEYIVFFAAGNAGGGNHDGTGGTAGTIGRPGNAKNVITVGAVEQKRYANNLLDYASDQQTDSDWQIAYFSSRGPVSTTDRRIKPDIVAPGAYVLSIQSHEVDTDAVDDAGDVGRDYRYGNINSGTNFAFFSGTSMATPIAAGAGALIYQFYTNAFNKPPSPAMMKAMMVAGARMLNTIVYKLPYDVGLVNKVDQGWGMLDVVRSVSGSRIRPTDEFILLDQDSVTPLATGQFFTRQIRVGPNEGGLKIVLAWTDPPGTPGNAVQLVNDLDLYVQAPGGGGYIAGNYETDGAHSRRFATIDPEWGDEYNNVETIVIPTPTPGTYSIQVYGYNVPQGPQDFALVIMKGIGMENRNEGSSPDLDIDGEDSPVIAYSTVFEGSRQIYVKRWVGEVGDISDYGKWRRMDGQWFELGSSGRGSGISRTLADSDEPSVATYSNWVYVAWTEAAAAPITKSRIFLKKFDGFAWVELGDSANNYGVSGQSPYNASKPVVAVLPDGNPIVAWKQTHSPATGERVFVVRWNGTAWVGLGGSHTNGIVYDNNLRSIQAFDMIVDSTGAPVVSWADPTLQRIITRRWTGTTWAALPDQGSTYVESPKLAAGPGGSIYLTWVETYSGNPLPYLSQQVYASRYVGTSWTPISGSTTFPGISAVTSGIPRRPSIAVSPQGVPFVTWVGGTNVDNSVFVKRAVATGWVGVAGADVPPGVARLGGVSRTPLIVTDSKGLPVVVFENTGGGASEVVGFKLAADSMPPVFAGLRSAVGGTASNVVLSWNAAVDNFSTTIYYYVYRGTTAWPCWDVPMCSPDEVFGNLIAVVTNATSFEVTGIPPYVQYCFGVRAMDESGFMESNRVTRYAGPILPGVPCMDWDSDGDGMPNHWEVLFGLNPYNPADAAQDADGDGLTNLQEYVLGTHPLHVDTDGDTLSDGAEVTNGTNPLRADSDRDGLDDNVEPLLGSDPKRADSNANGVSDGDVYQLGYDNPAAAVTNLRFFLNETFETNSPTVNAWTHRAPNPYLPLDLWHLSSAEPVGNVAIRTMDDRSPVRAYRLAYDPSATNPAATYSRGQPLICALDSPVLNIAGASNLFVAWRHFYKTEPIKDFVVVQARGDSTNWVVVSATWSGESGGWKREVASLRAFVGQTNLQLRFLFNAQNAINNDFPGWYVDDVMVYEGATIRGWVRDINGRPLSGIRVAALGRGGVDQVIEGHRHRLAAKVFGDALTAADGSYEIAGIPLGRYYVKAEGAGYRTEFWNGPLMSNDVYAFGNGRFPGVYAQAHVSTNGYLDLRQPSAFAAVHFELEFGGSPTFIGVSCSQSPTPHLVLLNHQPAQVWNGSTTSPAFVSYRTTNVFPRPWVNVSWYTNVTALPFYLTADVGEHDLQMDTNRWALGLARVSASGGDVAQVDIRTNVARSCLQVVSEDGVSRAIWVNGIATGSNTPSRVWVQAGRHRVQLVSAGGASAVREIVVPPAVQTSIVFTAEEVTGVPASLTVDARDSFGYVITGATVVLNGRVVTSNDVPPGTAFTTPALIPNLRPGTHFVSVLRDGLVRSPIRKVVVEPGLSNYVQFVLHQADDDCDGVGDYTEVLSYTNRFLFHGFSDPDGDGLSNQHEFDFVRLYGVFLNAFSSDTDQDGMPDGAEVGYKGQTHQSGYLIYGRSVLYTNAVQNYPSVQALFVGRYLEGISGFGVATAASIRGDRFEYAQLIHSSPAVPTVEPVVTTFAGVPTTGVSRAVSMGHPSGAEIYTDTRTDLVDTDGDGMWDGFEWKFKWMTNAIGEVSRILDPIENLAADEDPDWDGLNNYLEFLGLNGAADTNDWTNPGRSDTDGDGLPDGWEYFYGLKPLDPSDAWLDLDEDDLPNYIEYLVGSNPTVKDTDADGLTDGREVFVYGSDPTMPDTDYDGLLDGFEVQLGTGPNAWDTDGDGMPDSFEVLDAFGNLRPGSERLNPLDPTDADDDYDGDGLSNLEEYLVRDGLVGNMPGGVVWDYWLDPRKADSDGDGMPDGWEVWYGLHPMDPVPTRVPGEYLTRYSALSTGGDPDSDGLWNLREYNIRFRFDANANPYQVHGLSTDPWNPDTDSDGLGDGEEDRAFATHPLRQDSDGDGLTDGVLVTNRMGEVESVKRVSEYLVVATNVTWEEAMALAQVPHPIYTNIIGHLAVPNDPLGEEHANILALLTGVETNVALGGLVTKGGTVSWITGEASVFEEFGSGEPASKPGFLGLDAAAEAWISRPDGHIFEHFVIEWELVPTVTNHYDYALNDLWQLLWPSRSDLPYWRKVKVAKDSPLPPARWGAGMTYIPVFETKKPKDDTGIILLDNRKLVVIGGRDGVARHRDVWEFLIRSNVWVRSSAPLNAPRALLMDGLSELCVVPIFQDINTRSKDCPCYFVPYDCDGEDFGLPKNRPWTGHRSFDWTFVYGGWDEGNAYYTTHRFYKSSDDKRPITETNFASQGVTEFIDADGKLTAAVQDDEGVRTFLIGNPPCCMPLTGDTPDDDPTGYSAIQFEKFFLTPGCDQIEKAVLVLDIERSPTAPITVTVVAEMTRLLGHSDPQYASTLDTREPSIRVSDLTRYYNSSPVQFEINPGADRVEVDVTVPVQELISQDGWDATTIGFVFDATAYSQYAVVRLARSYLRVSYLPSYKKDPYWKVPTKVTYIGCAVKAEERKSAAMAYDYHRKRVVMFGGIDGNVVRGDTHEAQIGGGAGVVTWRHQTCAVNPPARYGHSMVYDAKNRRVLMFGGFDSNHRPLNDLWAYYGPTIQSETDEEETTTGRARWEQITTFTSSDRPQPRGGACMIYWGDWDYDRGLGDAYKASANKRKIVLFGGTDGKTYFNDTWVFDGSRWILANPNGELSQAPPPRAFASMVFAQNARNLPDPLGRSTYHGGLPVDPEGEDDDETPTKAAKMSAFLFGGRTGTMPMGPDTDMDLLSDGMEHALGGAEAGRDPRVNKLVEATHPTETIPYSFYRLGPIPLSPITPRAAVADMESLRHDEGTFAASRGFPWEPWPHPDSIITFSPITAGVETRRPEFVDLWFSRHGVGDPFDPKNKWELGVPRPDRAGAKAAPPYAYSGRWVFGTTLGGAYVNDAVMELYSPIFSLALPTSPETSTDANNMNSFYLIFHEWLDLADANDRVRVDVIRPGTPADVFNRVSATNKPPVTVVPERDFAHNTTGQWRRVIAPLDMVGGETDLYLRFTLISDSSRVAGGWYLDDVAIVQGGMIQGTISNAPGVEVKLYGINDLGGEALASTMANSAGFYQFGLLPQGQYFVYSQGQTVGPITLSDTNWSVLQDLTNAPPVAPFDLKSVRTVPGSSLTWEAVVGATYTIEYANELSSPNPWSVLAAGVVATNNPMIYFDTTAATTRFYRVRSP